MSELTVVTVTLQSREDGGLRVYSDDLPGLILSGSDRGHVVSKIAPAIQVLFERKGYRQVLVRPAKALSELLHLDGKRHVDMEVMHELFVVELADAA
jgi:hypothetical protein